MKKTLVALFALACATASAADYVWTGAAGDNLWTTQGNWNMNGTAWAANGPMTTNSNLWGETLITNGANISVTGLEGWQPKLTVDGNSSLTVSFGKMQGPGMYVTVCEGSTLNRTVTGDYKDNAAAFNINGSAVLDFTEDWSTPQTTINVAGVLTMKNVGWSSAGTIINMGDGYALTNLDVMGYVGTITLDNVYAENVIFGQLDFDFLNAAGDWNVASSLETMTYGEYYVGTNESGNVTVTYMVPEPATATLSLLALAGLAARRRRK